MLKNILEIFRYTELIKVLVGRNLKVRYKSSILGYAWTCLDPLLMMFTFMLVFGIILPTNVKNFPVYLLSGLVPWTFFSTSISGSVDSITGNAGLIKRVYYPREIFPLTITLGNGVNMFLSFLVLIPVILAFGLKITPKILFLPISIFFLFFFTFGLVLIFSCLNVFFRDISYIAPFIITLWFFLTPIFYTAEGRIPAGYLDIYMLLNPMAVILSLFRASLMDYPLPALKYIVAGFFTCILMFLAGYVFFKKNEDMMVKWI